MLSAQCSNRPPGTAEVKSGADAVAPQRPKPHDMTELVTSGYLDRLGFDYRPATPDVLFREPHKAREALAGGL
ncbi:MAG: hypothetical protein JOZ25_11385 [Actinobacteria bacterium]|nr:hypothetical protein [Actinomycetota bacterium]